MDAHGNARLISWLAAGLSVVLGLIKVDAAETPPAQARPGTFALVHGEPLKAAAFQLTPRMSLADLLAALDFSNQGLKAAGRSLRNADTLQAMHQVAQYFRERQQPRWFWQPEGTPRSSAERDTALLAEANRVLEHVLTSIGIRHRFGPKIDWTYNPTFAPGSPYARNNEWTWQLNRHWMWQTLAKAYWQSGDERYAREFVAELVNWIKGCPVPAEGANQKPFSTWRTIEAGLRMAYSWPDAFFAFRRSPSLPDSALLMMVASILEHGRYLKAYPTRGNWLTMEMDGLYTVGALFPEFKEARLFREFAIVRLASELDTQVYPDGAQIELTPGYHAVALRNFLRPYQLARLNGYAVPDGYRRKLERMFDFLMWIMTPWRSVPHLSDSWDVDVPRWLQEGVELFPQRADFLWIATGGKKGHPPKGSSHLFPYAGIAVMRTDWSDTASYLVMDAGPFGFGHQHEDKLSFTLTWRGVPFVVEAGSYAYDASKWRKYALSARGHNVVNVDGLEQHRRGHPRDTYVVHEPVRIVWRSTEQFDYVEAAYGGGIEVFGDGLRVRHTRRILSVKGDRRGEDYWLVLDSLEPFDADKHTYEWIFHFHVDSLVLAPSGDAAVAWRNGKGLQLAWTPGGEAKPKIVEGQTEPVVQGWLPYGHGRRGVRPIPTLLLKAVQNGRLHGAFVFAPLGTARGLAVRRVTLSGDWRHPRVGVFFADGRRDVVAWRLSRPPDWAVGRWAQSARVVVSRYRAGRLVLKKGLVP